MKTLIIGDIHGCLDELLELVGVAGIGNDDNIISVGDLVDRGPDSPGVLDFFRSRSNAHSVKGNHERKHVRSFRGLFEPALSQTISRRQFGEDRYSEACAFMDSLPNFIELPEALIVHGFFEPGIALDAQRESVLCGVMSGQKYLEHTYPEPWHQLYGGDKPIIVGHLSYGPIGEPVIFKDKVYCIDTGCCHGGRLTGVLLPGFELISVPAHADHARIVIAAHPDLIKRIEDPPPIVEPASELSLEESLLTLPAANLDWDTINEILDHDWSHLADDPAAQHCLTEVRTTAEQGNKAMHRIADAVRTESARLLVDVRKLFQNFDSLSEREQFERFMPHIDHPELARFLHRQRCGVFRPEELKKRFRSPSELIRIAGELRKN